MPGRTPSEAYRNFIDPIQAALACLGSAKITTSPGGTGNRKDVSQTDKHSWVINDARGITQGPLGLRAGMEYRFVDRSGASDVPTDLRWKIRTSNYIYKIEQHGRSVLEWHWHPESSLNVQFPHMHVQSALLLPDGLVTPRTHLPTGRTAFEQVVRALIGFGWTPQVEDWPERLDLSEGLFRLYSTWSQGQHPPVE